MKNLFATLAELGVSPATPLDSAITIRTSNLVALVMCAMSVFSVFANYLVVHTPALVSANLVLLLLYAVCPALNSSGHHNAARFLLIALVCVHFIMVNVALGPRNGFAFYIAGLGLIPIVMFAKTEKRMALGALGMLVITVAVTWALARLAGPIIALSPWEAEVAYYVTLAFMSAAVWGSLAYYHYFSLSMRKDLDRERRKTDELIQNMLPEWVVKRLKHGDLSIAESHGEASVLFADLVDFSGLTRRLSPSHLVEVLNRYFSLCDEIAARHRVEKIKTIGDCYMAATGLPTPSAAPVSAMAEFSLDLLEGIEALSKELGIPLNLRIGISTGAVISGVIGTQKFSFDLWGDTVNLASSMEAKGVAGRIHVTETTYMRLRQSYAFEERGEIDVKGHGSVETYFLLGHVADKVTPIRQVQSRVRGQ